MTPLNRTLLAAALVAAPLLLSAGEVVRKYVAWGEVDSGDPLLDARDKITHVAAHADLWLLHSYLTLFGILVWLGAMIATATVVSARRPVLGFVGGILGLGSAVGFAAHLGFYSIPLGVSAGLTGEELDAAVVFWAAGDGDPFLEAVILFFIVTMVLGQFVLGFGLWRARAVPWWAAACLPLSAALTLEPGRNPLWGLALLLPLLPFLFVAVNWTDRRPGGTGPMQRRPVSVDRPTG